MEKQRILFMDIARGVAIVVMLMQHPMLMYAVDTGENTILGDLFLLLGTAPAAPVFMFIMGVFFGKSRNADLRPSIMRGVTLLGLGYLLNIVRFTLPYLITGTTSVMLGESATPFSVSFVSDILQLAGLSLIAMALIKRYLPWRGVWPVLALGIGLVSPMLWPRVDALANYNMLWGSGETVAFPFFPFFIYPLLGMFYSRYLFETNCMSSLMENTVFLGLGFLGAGILTWDMFPIGDYSRSGLGVHLTIVGFLFLWLPCCWLLVEKMTDNAAFRLLSFWSKHVTVMYIIQWLIYGWGILALGANQHSSQSAVVIGLAGLALTHFFTKCYVNVQASSLVCMKSYKR